MSFNEKRNLGRTGLQVGRLGVSSSYGIPSAAIEEAFERGCNYFVLGSFMKGRSREMYRAICNIHAKGKRDQLVIALMDYTHSPLIGDPHFRRGLKKMGLDYVDVLLMGYYNRKPRPGILNWAIKMKEEGLIRNLGLTSHRRSVFPGLAEKDEFDLFHIRYNPVNSGAEKDVFPKLPEKDRPGIVSFTATRWGQLLKESKMPPGEKPLSASDCYRFVLNHPAVDVCMVGARTSEMMRENLKTLEMDPLSPEELTRIRKIGDFIYGKAR